MIAHVQFEFSSCMLPGAYFCNCGIFGTVDGEQVVLHRIVDALMFKVAPESDLIAIGKVDIGALPRIRFTTVDHCSSAPSPQEFIKALGSCVSLS
jgi:hypothetical protein